MSMNLMNRGEAGLIWLEQEFIMKGERTGFHVEVSDTVTPQELFSIAYMRFWSLSTVPSGRTQAQRVFLLPFWANTRPADRSTGDTLIEVVIDLFPFSEIEMVRDKEKEMRNTYVGWRVLIL